MPNIIYHLSNIQSKSHVGDNSSFATQQLVQKQVATFNIKFQMLNFKCQILNFIFHISNVPFQISHFKFHVGDNPSCATQQLAQNQMATSNMSNFKCQISNVKFQMSNLNAKYQM